MIKRGIIFVTIALFLFSFASAEIIFTEEIDSLYNLGDVIEVPVTIKAFEEISGNLNIDLICNGTPINFYKNGIQLSTGQEKKIDSSIILIKNVIGNEKGICKIKAILNGEYALTKEFEISGKLNIDFSLWDFEFDVGDIISIEGLITRESKEKADGIVNVEIVGSGIRKEAIINKGKFETEITIPETLRAGNYVLRITASEKDNYGSITNEGEREYDIQINQKPKNLELVLEKEELYPGEIIKVKAILHDQTGDSMDSTVFITIKDSSNKILEQKEVQTEETIEYQIKQKELPSDWKIFAMSNKISAEKIVPILDKENISISILNKTVYIENTGNVAYKKQVLIQIENESITLDVDLRVGESKKYLLKAPDGEYNVRIASEELELNELISLTGNAVEVKETFSYKSPSMYFWIILILFLSFVMWFCWKKVYKKSFFGKINIKARPKKEKEIPVIGREEIKRGNRAEVSLSIKGEKQDASFVCLKVKDRESSSSKKGSAYETISKIREIAEGEKSAVYENGDYLFFIFAPAKTRTFKNEKIALEFAENVQEILLDHNKRFNEKLQFGISLDYGTIVGKIEKGIFYFMSMGPVITNSRKIASLEEEKILLSPKINDLLRVNIKTEKRTKDGTDFYIITKIKKENQEAKDFIDKFMRRQSGN
jgi:ABC-type phosphate transport system auxiliary subunit